MIKSIYQTSDGKTFHSLQEAEEHEARKPYTVSYDLTGYVSVVVYARSEEEARHLADEQWYEDDISWEIVETTIEKED